MKRIFYLTLIGLITSCGSTQKMGIIENDIEKVEVFQGGETIEMKDGLEDQLIEDLNNAKYNGPTKFMKTHRILIFHSNGSIDTVLTNGQVYQYNGWYKSEDNLIEKYRR